MNNQQFPEDPHFITIVNQNGTAVKELTDHQVTINGTTVSYELNGQTSMITLQSGVPVSLIKLRWDYRFDKRALFLGDAVERGYGSMGWHKMTPNRILPWYFMENLDQRTRGFGVMTQPNAFCLWQIDPDGISLILDVRNGGNGVELGDRQLTVATIITRYYEGISAFQATSEFCQAMCPHPVLPDAPIYGSNNWYYAYGRSSATDIERDTTYLAKLTKGIKNRPFMVIDDGWQVDHQVDGYNGGPWRSGNHDFPDMKALAKAISDQGVKPGIWFRPLLDHRPSIPDKWRTNVTADRPLDPTQPGVLSQIKADVTQLCQWGYRLIKHDFTTYDLFGKWGFQMRPLVTDEGWNFADHTLTNAEVVKQLYRVIYETAAQYHTMILGCNTIGHLGAGLMQAARIGDDTSGKEWERTRQIGVNSLAFRLPQNNAFYSIDADCVGITDQIDWQYNYQWARVVAESGTILFISPAPGAMDEEEEAKLQPLLELASHQSQHFQPIDWQLIDCPADWSDGQTTHHYDWYERNGIPFDNQTPRSVPIYTIAR